MAVAEGAGKLVRQPQVGLGRGAARGQPGFGQCDCTKDRAKATGGGWRIGESVAHAKFGEGVIVNIEGGGGNARAQINFGQHGMKVLDLGIAKLERL